MPYPNERTRLMAHRIPDPVQTARGPAYEGRLLDRPDDEVVDQGARFDMGTLLTRRTLLGVGLAGAGTIALAACAGGSAGSGATSAASASPAAGLQAASLPSAEIPDETAGPYPGDGSNGPDVLEQSGIVRRDLRSSLGANAPVDGVPLEVAFTLTDMAGGDAPLAGAAVYAWHCNAEGLYSMYSQGVEDESWLRGVQVAGADGAVSFTTIVPGCYSGRWTHIHFEVYPDLESIADPANAIATSQMAFPAAVLDEVYAQPAYAGSAENLAQITLATDNVFGDDEGELQMATMTGDPAGGYLASLVVRVDTTTAPTGGGAPGGGGPGGGPPAGP